MLANIEIDLLQASIRKWDFTKDDSQHLFRKEYENCAIRENEYDETKYRRQDCLSGGWPGAVLAGCRVQSDIVTEKQFVDYIYFLEGKLGDEYWLKLDTQEGQDELIEQLEKLRPWTWMLFRAIVTGK